VIHKSLRLVDFLDKLLEFRVPTKVSEKVLNPGCCGPKLASFLDKSAKILGLNDASCGMSSRSIDWAISAQCCCEKTLSGSRSKLGILPHFGPRELQKLARFASDCPFDIARDLLGSGEHEIIHNRDIATGHPEARVTKQSLNG
jgi:hypothetical protein